MDAGIELKDILCVGISILCGGIIGFEREYRNKTAGFRTIILICLGSTIFTIVSAKAGNGSDDRIAANIITGIGFIGAGVIFKDNVSISGLTTAAVIWISAAIGMVIGTGNYYFGLVLSLIVLFILSVFNRIENLIDVHYLHKNYLIRFRDTSMEHLEKLEAHVKMKGLKSRRRQIGKMDQALIVTLEVKGKKHLIAELNDYMVLLPEIEQVNQTNASNSSILAR
jgi:putative Mg2+ transporter-C (MgtC) family protein